MNVDNWVDDRFKCAKLSESNLHGYQNIAADFMITNPESALFLDTGLGKTAACIKVINQLVMNDTPGLILIIGPLRVVNVTWPDEFSDWTFGCPISFAHIRDEAVVEYTNRKGREAKQQAKDGHPDFEAFYSKERMLKRNASLSDEGLRENLAKVYFEQARQRASGVMVRRFVKDNPTCVHLVNQEQVEFLVNAWGRDWPYKTVIIDESSSLKDHSTNRWKALWKVRPLIKRMHQLTATPASETYLHLFAQITLLDRGARFGRSFTAFAEKYFTYNQYSRKYTLRDGAEAEITKAIADICIVMKQQDYLDLQQPQFIYHKVRLDKKQLALYRQMETDFVVELPDGAEVEAETASALSQKLLQMASGVLYETVQDEQPDGTFKDRRVVHDLHNHKIEALRQLREELNGEHVLVAYYHQSSLDRLLKAFPDSKVMDKDGKLIESWNKGKIPMLLLHPQSGAHGLNLQRGGRHVVFYDMIWSYERYYQFYRRLARQGQKELVIVHHLIARDTKDELVAECLQNKCDAQEVLFKWITKIRKQMRERKLRENGNG